MRFKEIYDRIIPLWGDTIDISDGRAVNPESEEGSRGFLFESLSNLWDEVEKTVGHKDPFGDLMVWTMFQVFHTHAKKQFSEGVFVLGPRIIDKNETEAQYFTNLNEEGWENELAAYERGVD